MKNYVLSGNVDINLLPFSQGQKNINEFFSNHMYRVENLMGKLMYEHMYIK